ncbi:MAG: hypothetical protein B7Z22_14110 [Hyphomonas sp. 32-62-5]|nr:MAG: hypothetical protein B7Z22_14110 [Hyphomonas sp. 32-62-5]
MTRRISADLICFTSVSDWWQGAGTGPHQNKRGNCANRAIGMCIIVDEAAADAASSAWSGPGRSLQDTGKCGKPAPSKTP